jgi:hypothetical protein
MPGIGGALFVGQVESAASERKTTSLVALCALLSRQRRAVRDGVDPIEATLVSDAVRFVLAVSREGVDFRPCAADLKCSTAIFVSVRDPGPSMSAANSTSCTNMDLDYGRLS